MQKTYPLNRDENIVMLASKIVYNQKPYWCNATARQMSFSFMSPRKYYDYDRKEKQPCLVFICGGGFEKQSITAWVPELAFYAKHGYSVAIVDYSVLPFTKWPEQIQDVKAAIRYIRAHADELWIDPDHIAVMGESAGGYLASMVATTGNRKDYDVGENLDQSSAVQCAVPLWPVVDLPTLRSRPSTILPGRTQGDPQTKGAPDAASFISKDTPPVFIVCGIADKGCHAHTEYFLKKLDSAGIENHFIDVEDAGHADAGCVTSAIKKDILAFLDRHMKP